MTSDQMSHLQWTCKVGNGNRVLLQWTTLRRELICNLLINKVTNRQTNRTNNQSTPWNSLLHTKLIYFCLVIKIPASFGTIKIIVMLTRTDLSPEPCESTPYSPIMLFDSRLVIIISATCRSTKWSLRVFQPKPIVRNFSFFLMHAASLTQF